MRGGSKPKVKIGDRYGRLVVVARHPYTNSGHLKWVCVCDCGGLKAVESYRLRKGITSSCGCLQEEWLKSDKPHLADNRKKILKNRVDAKQGVCMETLIGRL